MPCHTMYYMVEAWKMYAKKQVNLQHKLSRNKTEKIHTGEYLLFERLYMLLEWSFW